MRRTIARVCAAAVIAITLTIVPTHAAVTPACATQHSPARIWSGEALSQTFTPSGGQISGFETKLFFRRAFDGLVEARLQLHPPVTASDQIAVRGIEIARVRARIAGRPNTSTWARFTLSEPIPAPAVDGAVLEIELRPSSDPAWAWLGCASDYRGGRAYGRAAVGIAGLTVPNEVAKLTLSGSADLQFRVHG